MNTLSRSIPVLIALLAIAGTADAQQIKNGTLSGAVVAKSAAVPRCMSGPPTTCPTVDVYTTPTSGFLVITQVCGANSLVIGATETGIYGSYNDQCTTLDPGYPVPPGTTIRAKSGVCCDGGTDPFSIIGVQTTR